MEILIVVASLVGFVALTLGTALFVASEFSLTALERSTIRNDVERVGDRRSRAMAKAHGTLSFQLSGAQLGITITTLITGYIAEPVLARLIIPVLSALRVPENAHSAIALIIALVLATSLSMVLGELVPKNLAIAEPLAVARATSGPMLVFSTVFGPAIRGLNRTANALVRRLGVEPTEELGSARSAAELGALVRNSALRGSLDEDTAALVDRSLRFGDRTAEDLMTPRTALESLEPDDTVHELMSACQQTGHSRFLVAQDGDLDNLLGVVHIKQAFAVPTELQASIPLHSIVRPVTRVPDSLDGDSLMERIQADGLELCVVIDEYGGTAGLVTSEDLIEEILGDVTDEHDDEAADITGVGDGYRCSGLLRIDELEGTTGYHAPEGAYETLGGLVMYCLGRIPRQGDTVVLPPDARPPTDDDEAPPPVRWRATVLEMDQRRIEQVWLLPADDSAHPDRSANPDGSANSADAPATGEDQR